MFQRIKNFLSWVWKGICSGFRALSRFFYSKKRGDSMQQRTLTIVASKENVQVHLAEYRGG